MKEELTPYFFAIREPFWSYMVDDLYKGFDLTVASQRTGWEDFDSLLIFHTNKRAVNDEDVCYYVVFGVDYTNKRLIAISRIVDWIDIRGTEAHTRMVNKGYGFTELWFVRIDGTRIKLHLRTPAVTTILTVDVKSGIVDL